MIIAEKENIILIGKESVPYKIVKGRRNRVRLFFSEENILVVETSNGRLEEFDRQFLQKKARWVARGFNWYRRENVHRQNLLSGIDKSIMILGAETPVEFCASDKTYFRYRKYTDFKVFAPMPWLEQEKKRLLFQSLRRLAHQFLNLRMDHWLSHCEMRINQLRVRDLSSKWGSCSSLGNISLNWHLIFMEEKVIDYVIIHELMHLKEMNHSPAFWNLVEQYMPDYKIYDNKLKENQWMIGILK